MRTYTLKDLWRKFEEYGENNLEDFLVWLSETEKGEQESQNEFVKMVE